MLFVSSTRSSWIIFLLSLTPLLLIYNNCSGLRSESQTRNLSSAADCNLFLKEEFSRGFHVFLKTNCSGCHRTGGGGNGAFADNDLDLAFDAFQLRGPDLIGSRAQDINHQPPWTGPQHTVSITELKSQWANAEQSAQSCLDNDTDNTDEETSIFPIDPVYTTATIETYVKPLAASATRKTIKWNLATEILRPSGLSFQDAELSIDVEAATTINGDKSYIFSNPKLKAGGQALHLSHIGFKINNALVSNATSYNVLNRRVPANLTRDLAGGSITFPYNIQNEDVVALTIGRLDVIDFAPPTFANLISPTGVFGRNCLSCHSTEQQQGDFDISTRQNLINRIYISPYSPNNSPLLLRMVHATNPMPPTGALGDDNIKQVLDWVLDGAP